MAKGDNIEERLIDFAVMIIKLCAQLPKLLAPAFERQRKKIYENSLAIGNSPLAIDYYHATSNSTFSH